MWSEIIEAKKEMGRPELDSVGHTGKNGSREYPYSSLKAILDVVEPPLLARGLMPTQHFDGDDYLLTEVRSANEVTLMDKRHVHRTGNPQDDGGRETYAKRYALTSAFGLTGDMDNDGAGVNGIDADVAFANAKRRLWEAVKRYAELQGRDPNEVITAVKGEKGYTETAEHMNLKAEEFEAACQVNDAG